MTEQQELVLTDLISYRFSSNGDQIVGRLKEWLDRIARNTNSEISFLVSMTHSSIVQEQNTFSDVEFLVPNTGFDEKTSTSETRKELFRVTNAVHHVHDESPASVGETLTIMQNYISTRKLVPITPFVTLQRFDPKGVPPNHDRALYRSQSQLPLTTFV